MNASASSAPMASHQPQVRRRRRIRLAEARKSTRGVTLSPSYGKGNRGDTGLPKSSGNVPEASRRMAPAADSSVGSATVKKDGSGDRRADSATVCARSAYTGIASTTAATAALAAAPSTRIAEAAPESRHFR